MDYLNTNAKWDDFFIQELVELEEKMGSFDMEALSKSKLRLCLENKILTWSKYEEWALENLGCSSLKEDVSEETLQNFIANARDSLNVYSNYKIWNEDLIPVFMWENQLVVFGLHYNENLIGIENHIFILANPETLTYFSNVLFNSHSTEDELDRLEKSFSQTVSTIEGLSLDIAAPKMNFKDLSLDAALAIPTLGEEEKTQSGASYLQPVPESNSNNIWDFITERHEEYCFEAKKLFDAYIVLKIDDSITSVFKMDADLAKDNINEKIFEYNLKEENPFARVYSSGVSEAFNVSQLGLPLAEFKYACITSLKRSNETVGFLVGFKKGNMSESDQDLLEELAKESAA